MSSAFRAPGRKHLFAGYVGLGNCNICYLCKLHRFGLRIDIRPGTCQFTMFPRFSERIPDSGGRSEIQTSDEMCGPPRSNGCLGNISPGPGTIPYSFGCCTPPRAGPAFHERVGVLHGPMDLENIKFTVLPRLIRGGCTQVNLLQCILLLSLLYFHTSVEICRRACVPLWTNLQ